MSDTFASTEVLTELARSRYFDPRRDFPIRDETVVKLVASDPIRRLPDSTKRNIGWLASYENDEGTFLMMGIAAPLEGEDASSSHAFPVVEGWYVTVMESGGIPLEGLGSTPPPVLVRGCLQVDDHVVANGFYDMTGTAARVVGGFNGQTHVQQFDHRAAVICCEFSATAGNRLSGELSVIDDAGNALYRQLLDTPLDFLD
jgi:hypothetical protein